MEDERKEDSHSIQAYYELLQVVKRHSKKDNIYISFWEGLHRHAAIIMALLCSENKLNSATRTLPTLLSDSLLICAPQPVSTITDNNRPEIEDTYHLQRAMTETAFNKAKKKPKKTNKIFKTN